MSNIKLISVFSLFFSTIIIGSTTFSDQLIISQSQTIGVRSVCTSDLDCDGDMDVLSASYNDNKIAWYENNNQGQFLNQKIITQETMGAISVYASDLDGDGDMDVLYASYNDSKIAWCENDGYGVFSNKFIITQEARYASIVYASDLDGDGDQDVLSNSGFSLIWYQNDGNGQFSNQYTLAQGGIFVISILTADLDGDMDQDVLFASSLDNYFNEIAWCRNNGNGQFSEKETITTNTPYLHSIYSIDINLDGYMDVLSASEYDNKIAWYENDGSGVFSEQKIITTDANGAYSVYANDLDNDGDPDVLSASIYDNKIVWYENDGNGLFSKQKIITTDVVFPVSILAADLDGDGDNDVISASIEDKKIAWYKNLLDNTDVDDFITSSNKYSQLIENFPNPFNTTSIIKFELKKKSDVKINIYNTEGKLVTHLVNDHYSPGIYQVTFNGAQLPSGIYFIHLQAGNYTEVKRTILLK